MSSYRAYSFSDNIDVRQPSAGSKQGPSIAHILDGAGVPPPADQLRKAGLFATSVAIRDGWEPDVLADVLGALGVKA